MAQSTNNASKTEKTANRPVQTIRYGSVRAAIWRNMVDNGNASKPMYNVTFSRSYKDGLNNWKESSGFGLDDLLLLAKAADKAHSWIAKQRPVDTESGAMRRLSANSAHDRDGIAAPKSRGCCHKETQTNIQTELSV
jgi:hypothetical protein